MCSTLTLARRAGCALLLALASAAVFAEGADTASLRWFRDAKLGLFLHWGLYSQTAGDWQGHPAEGGEHFMLYERIPFREYARIADEFNPTDFDARRWARDARRAGMRDVVPDFRYTRRADTVYVIVRHVAAPSFLLRAFRPTDAVKAVESLDTRRPARWQLTAEGLRVTPDVHPGRYPVYVLKVTLKGEG